MNCRLFSIGVDLGGTKIRVALMDETGRLMQDEERPTLAKRGPRPIISDIVAMVMKARSGVTEGELVGVGVGCPGPLNPKAGIVLSPPNLPGWDNVPLRQELSEAFGLPTYLDNDANVAGLAEHRYGAGQGTTDMVYFTVSTGIGGAAIVNGRLVQGGIGAAAEFGHMIVDIHGPECRCGNRGCLEAIASGTAIALRGTQDYRTQVTAAEVASFAASGDERALRILNEAFYALGIGVVNVINAFDPQMVVIGGGVAQIGDSLFRVVREVAAAQSFRDKNQPVPIVPAKLHRDSGVIGAAAIPFAKLDPTEV